MRFYLRLEDGELYRDEHSNDAKALLASRIYIEECWEGYQDIQSGRCIFVKTMEKGKPLPYTKANLVSEEEILVLALGAKPLSEWPGWK